MARKCALNVRMALSAALRRWTLGEFELIFGVPGVFDDISVGRSGFVVEELHINRVDTFFQPLLDGVVGFNTVFVTACLEQCLEDGVAISVV